MGKLFILICLVITGFVTLLFWNKPSQAGYMTLDGAFVELITNFDLTPTPDDIFSVWVEHQKANMAWVKLLPSCPEKLALSETKNGHIQVVQPDLNIWSPVYPAGQLHFNAIYEMRSKRVKHHSNQCTYDDEGSLIVDSRPAAGTADFFAPEFSEHQTYDVKPFGLAVLLGRMDEYYDVRPSK